MNYLDAIGWVIGFLTIAVLALVGWMMLAVWVDSQRPTFELKRDDWTCTKNETRSQSLVMLVGKVPMPFLVNSTACVEYRRKTD